MINTSNEGICLSFEEKTTQPLFTYFQMGWKYLKYAKTNPLNIIFDDFSI